MAEVSFMLGRGPNDADILVGFVTARLMRMHESDSVDRVLMGLDSPAVDGDSALYILTIGVVEEYRKLGIASRLLQVGGTKCPFKS
jgi:ribosomal protein S18 acetylase RimI-like enzyme